MTIAAPRPRRSLVAVLLALVASALPVTAASPARAAEPCTLTATPGFTMRVCLEQPTGVVTLAGQVPVVARLDFPVASVPPPPVRRVEFWLGGEYLLTDRNPEPDGSYGFTWRTARARSSAGDLLVRVVLVDGSVGEHRTPVTLADAGTAAPNPAVFQVRHGTTPAPGQRFRLVAVGDAASGSPTERQMAGLMASWQPNLLTYLGDVYDRGSPYEFDNWYGDPAGIGQFRNITNPAIGNHEPLTAGGAGYVEYWDNIPHYYSYDVAGWHVVTMDSTDEFGQLAPGTAQYDWLAADLGANRARCTIVTMHHPRYSDTNRTGRASMAHVWSLLAARRVTLALTGHTHHYERWVPMNGTGAPDPRGVTEMIAGAGGLEVSAAGGADRRLAARVTDLPGALVLDLGPDDARFSYLTSDGVARDTGTVGCKSTGDPLPPTVPSAVRVSPVTAARAHLSWAPSRDTYGTVSGYRVRRNGKVVGRVGVGSRAYLAAGLVGGRRYTWTVEAVDSSQNVSAASAGVARTMPRSATARVSSRTLLRGLTRRHEVSRGYAASRFGSWVDIDRDGCATPATVLLGEAVRPPLLQRVCRITGGRWRSSYDAATTADRARLGVEPLVPLAEAWSSGARSWAPRTRRTFRNDLGYRPSLNVATRTVIAARGSAEPQQWLPPRAATRCQYTAQWVAVKWRWRLSVDPVEARFLTRRLRSCGWPRVDRPARAR